MDPYRSNIGGPDHCGPCGVDAYDSATRSCQGALKAYKLQLVNRSIILSVSEVI